MEFGSGIEDETRQVSGWSGRGERSAREVAPAGPRHLRNTPDVEAMSQVERSLERLFRLSMGRRVLARQTDAVGAAVSRAGYAVLRSLHDQSPLTMGELAARCHMDPAVAARQVGKLEEDGLVHRAAHDGDGRVRMIEPTRLGTEVYGRIVGMRTAFMSRALGDWSAADRRRLMKLVDRLVDDLQRQPFTGGEED